MRRLNLRFAFLLLTLTVLLGVGVAAAHYLQRGRIARGLLAQATAAQEQDNPALAVKFLGRYLEFVPTDVEERARLARLLSSKELISGPRGKSRALHALEQVLGRDPDRREERRLLVRLALESRDATRAGEHLKILTRNNEPDADAEELFGRFHEQQEKFQDAANWYRKALTTDPTRVESCVRLARLVRRHPPEGLEDPAAEADRLMDSLIRANPQSWQARLARWNHARDFQDLKDPKKLSQAAGDVETAQRVAGEETEVMVAVIELRQRQGQLQEARTLVDRALKSHPDTTAFHRAAVALETDAGNRERATARLWQALQQLPENAHYEFQWALVHLLTEEEDPKAPARPVEQRESELTRAEDVINRLRKGASTAPSADYLQGRICVLRKQWDQAIRLLERARPSLEKNTLVASQIDRLLARCYGETFDPGRQAVVCERLVKQDPTASSAYLALAASEAALGRIEGALETYRKALKLPDASNEGRLQFVRLLTQYNRNRGLGNWEEVEQTLREAEKVQPDAVEIALAWAEAYAVQNRYPDATRVLETACSKDTAYRSSRLRLALALLRDRNGDSAGARQLLDEVEKRSGDSADLRVARALTLARLPAEEATQALTRLEQGLPTLAPADQTRVLTALAEAQAALGRYREAESLWTRLASLPGSENDTRLRLVLCELALQTGNEAGLTQALADLRRMEGGEGPSWSLGEALRLMGLARRQKPSDLVQARRLLEQASAQRPAWTALALAKAELAELENRPEQAIADYRQALHLGERSPRVSRRLVELLFKQQRYREADEEVRGLLQQAPVPRGIQALAADIFLHTRDRKEAVQLAVQAVSPESNDARDQLWLGLVLAASGKDSATAEAHLRKALTLGEQQPDIWVTLIQFLASRDRLADAEKLLAEAAVKLPPDRAALALAPCLETLGRREEAELRYREALQARPDDVAVLRSVGGFYLRTLRPQLAEPLLRRLADRKVRASEEDAAWARLGLATVLASRGDRAGFEEAISLVGLTYDAAGRLVDVAGSEDSVERRRTRARVLATRPSRSLRTRAVAILEDLEAREGLGDGDRFLLAQLFETLGEPTKALEHLRRLAMLRNREPLYLARYAQALFRQGKSTEAAPLVERLEELEKTRRVIPGTYGTVDLRARLLEGTGEADKAIALLQQHVARSPRPEEFLLIVQSYLRQKRYAEAARVCENAWKTCAPEIVAGTHVSVLQMGRLGRDDVERAERLLETALTKRKDSSALLLAMAGLKGLSGRFDEEERYYRLVLQVDPRHVVALNNLAWLLSQRSGKAAEALTYVKRAIEIFGQTPDLLDTRALVYLALGQTDLARSDLEEALADTASAARYFHLARVCQSAGENEAAAAALAKAKSLGLKRGQLHPVEQLACAKLLEGVEER